jgi:hypothetical protein
MKRWLALLLPLLCLAGSPALAREAPEARFDRAAAELEKSDYDAAIIDLEGLADRGFVHPDVSFDRGVAYAMRARTQAEAALDAVRAEVTRRRSRRAKDDLIVRPSLDRLVVGLLPGDAWAALAMGSSLLLAIGLLLRKKESGPIHVAGSVIAPAAVVALIAFTPLAVASRWLADHRRPGVIVASEVTFADANGKSKGGNPIPEAASVEVGDKLDDNIFVRWGSNDGYVPINAVRVLQQ